MPAGKVLRVDKALYGLKQSGREWYLEACAHFEGFELRPTLLTVDESKHPKVLIDRRGTTTLEAAFLSGNPARPPSFSLPDPEGELLLDGPVV